MKASVDKSNDFGDERLWAKLKPYLEEEHRCVICDGSNFETWATKEYLEAKRCLDCKMVSVNPHFSKEGLNELYSSYFTHRQDDIVKKQQRDLVYQIDRDWVSLFVDGGKVLDVGCSGGFFLSKFPSDKWERFGVEIAADAAKYAKDTFGIPVEVGDIVEMEFSQQFDLVMLRGTIEHFSDPISVLKKCSELLKPGGCLFITATPAGDSFGFDVYREKWGLFTPLEHIHFFSVKVLSKVLKDFGLDLVSYHYQYEETPYANPEQDYKKIQQDICHNMEGNRDQVSGSGPFPGNMITALWKKN